LEYKLSYQGIAEAGFAVVNPGFSVCVKESNAGLTKRWGYGTAIGTIGTIETLGDTRIYYGANRR